MSLFTSPADALPPPTLQGGELPANATGTVIFTVGPWAGFNDGDTVQVLGGFGSQILGSTVVAARKSFLGGFSKVDTVDVPVPADTPRALGTGSLGVKARWIPKNGVAFGDKFSAETTVQICGAS